eukprot:NODE_1580_length_2431_cov_3.652778.p1 GENE.NODE_1580_length_2431_cov_3.652778~~NODE_1580_length_2431_cov_3.652778.p1  ORF type:complete len:765 (-),score=231.41 NODE_1580_length_2431_cov_3.652778:137-2113(-)
MPPCGTSPPRGPPTQTLEGWQLIATSPQVPNSPRPLESPRMCTVAAQVVQPVPSSTAVAPVVAAAAPQVLAQMPMMVAVPASPLLQLTASHGHARNAVSASTPQLVSQSSPTCPVVHAELSATSQEQWLEARLAAVLDRELDKAVQSAHIPVQALLGQRIAEIASEVSRLEERWSLNLVQERSEREALVSITRKELETCFEASLESVCGGLTKLHNQQQETAAASADAAAAAAAAVADAASDTAAPATSRLDELEVEFETFRRAAQRFAELEDNNALEANASAADETAIALSTRVDRLEKDYSALQEHVRRMEEASEEPSCSGEVSHLQDGVQQLEYQLDVVRQLYDARLGDIESLDQSVRSLHDMINHCAAESKDHVAQIWQDLEAERDARCRDFTDLGQCLSGSVSDLSTRLATHDEMLTSISKVVNMKDLIAIIDEVRGIKLQWDNLSHEATPHFGRASFSDGRSSILAPSSDGWHSPVAGSLCFSPSPMTKYTGTPDRLYGQAWQDHAAVGSPMPDKSLVFEGDVTRRESFPSFEASGRIFACDEEVHHGESNGGSAKTTPADGVGVEADGVEADVGVRGDAAEGSNESYEGSTVAAAAGGTPEASSAGDVSAESATCAGIAGAAHPPASVEPAGEGGGAGERSKPGPGCCPSS